MYKILLGFFNPQETAIIKDIFIKLSNIHIIECYNINDLIFQINKQDIDLFLFNMDFEDININIIPFKIRELPKFKFTEIIFFSKKPENLVSIFLKIDSANYFLLPFNTKEQNRLLSLINHFQQLNNKSSDLYCKFSNNNSTQLINVEEILFIESFNRKAIVHTTRGEIVLNMTFKKAIDLLPENHNFIKTHRAYIVNPIHINSLLQENDTWLINFNNADKNALISRNNRSAVSSYFNQF